VTGARFGPGIGFATAGGASLLYLLASLGGMHHLDWNHLAARIAPLFLLGGSLGYLGRRERMARAEAEHLNRELEAHQADLERAYRDLQSAQTRLVQSERLATIGQMSAKVSHEVRNPLSSISLNLELMEDEVAGLPADRRIELARLLGAVRSQVGHLPTKVRKISQRFTQLMRIDGCPAILVSPQFGSVHAVRIGIVFLKGFLGPAWPRRSTATPISTLALWPEFRSSPG
jgi:signal transduction histidine kinase